MNHETVDPIQLLRAEVDRIGSIRKAAAVMGISFSLISYVLSGERAPAGKLLDYLGLEKRVEKKVTYLRKVTKPLRRKKGDRASAEV